MAFTETSRFGLPQWGNGNPDGPTRSQFNLAFSRIDTYAVRGEDAATRPAPGIPNRLFRNSSTNGFSWDTGTSWVRVGSYITNDAAGDVPLTVRGFASQSVDLLRVQDSGAGNRFRVDQNGNGFLAGGFQVNYGATSVGGQFGVASVAPNQAVAAFRVATGQTSNGVEVQNVAGTPTGWIAADGTVFSAGQRTLNLGSFGGSGAALTVAHSDHTHTGTATPPPNGADGVVKLYRRDASDAYSVQTYFTGTRWRLFGYDPANAAHADTEVGYALNAGNANTLDGVGAGSLSVSAAATATNSNQTERVANDSTYMRFHWSGQSGQPPWLWGGSTPSDMYVYNPSNFNVSYANSAGTAYGKVEGQLNVGYLQGQQPSAFATSSHGHDYISRQGDTSIPGAFTYTNPFPMTFTSLTAGATSALYVSSGGVLQKQGSTRRIKHDIEPMTLADARGLLAVEPSTFRVNDALDPRLEGGLIAEDLQEKFPVAAYLDDGGVAENFSDRAVIAGLLLLVQDLESRLSTVESA